MLAESGQTVAQQHGQFWAEIGPVYESRAQLSTTFGQLFSNLCATSEHAGGFAWPGVGMLARGDAVTCPPKAGSTTLCFEEMTSTSTMIMIYTTRFYFEFCFAPNLLLRLVVQTG